MYWVPWTLIVTPAFSPGFQPQRSRRLCNKAGYSALHYWWLTYLEFRPFQDESRSSLERYHALLCRVAETCGKSHLVDWSFKWWLKPQSLCPNVCTRVLLISSWPKAALHDLASIPCLVSRVCNHINLTPSATLSEILALVRLRWMVSIWEPALCHLQDPYNVSGESSNSQFKLISFRGRHNEWPKVAGRQKLSKLPSRIVGQWWVLFTSIQSEAARWRWEENNAWQSKWIELKDLRDVSVPEITEAICQYLGRAV